jgi:hypothetical protein
MASRHAGFAAVTVVSEALVNQVLGTYLNTFLTGVRLPIQDLVSQPFGGSPATLQVSASAALISARANLRRNTAGLVPLTFRFFGRLQAEVRPIGGGDPLASFAPEIVIEVDVTAALTTLVVNDHIQFGVTPQGSHLGDIRVIVVDGDGMPPDIQSRVVQAIVGPPGRTAAAAFLASIDPNKLRVTPGTVPAFYDFTVPKPLQPGEVWAAARIATSRVVYWPMNGAMALACDVPGFTQGTPADLTDFRMNSEISAATNLDFMQAYFASAVLPQMRNAFVKNNFRIDSINFLRFTHRDLVNGAADYLELGLNCSYWTHDFLHFAIAGTTKISDIDVVVPAAPYVYGDKEIRLTIGMIEADLPDWLDVAILGFSMILPPLTLFLPAIIDSALHNALVDVSSKLNGGPAPMGATVREDFALPGTSGPTYRFTPKRMVMQCQAGERSATIHADLRSVGQPELRVALADQNVTVDTQIDRQEIRRNGGLSDSITARLVLPPAYVQRKDPSLRVRFETTLNGKVVPEFTRDLRMVGELASMVLGKPIDPLVLSIDTKEMVSPTKPDQEVRISCRLYRSMGGVTEDLYNGSVYILSVDPRPDELKLYVQWAHKAIYYDKYKRVVASRRSKIHKVPGKGGCRFSNQYLSTSMYLPGKFISLRRFTGLPFDLIDIEDNRDLVCPYCFFGGPDKHPNQFIEATTDLTGAVGKVFKP